MAQLTSERTRQIDQRIVPGDPASALLTVAGNDPANLIVVGNSGLGAVEGQRLGSVPSKVVRNASCDVLIVQAGSKLSTAAGKSWQPEILLTATRRRPSSRTFDIFDFSPCTFAKALMDTSPSSSSSNIGGQPLILTCP